MYKKQESVRGITIIETAVSIAIFISAILAVVSTIQYFYKTNTYAVEQAGAVTSANRGVIKLVRTIREAAYSANGAYPIVSLAPHDFILYADTDGDNRAERMHYFVEGNNLKRGSVTPSSDLQNPYTEVEQVSIISDSVRNIEQGVNTFTYYDQSGVEITNYSNVLGVRFVSITVIVNVDPNKLPNQLTLHSSAALRNLR